MRNDRPPESDRRNPPYGGNEPTSNVGEYASFRGDVTLPFRLRRLWQARSQIRGTRPSAEAAVFHRPVAASTLIARLADLQRLDYRAVGAVSIDEQGALSGKALGCQSGGVVAG